jgi:hypothetical protein
MTSRFRRNTFIGVEASEDGAEPEDVAIPKFKQFGQFIISTVPSSGTFEME